MIRISPLTPTIGATVEGVDLRACDPAMGQALRAALHEYRVLFFPGQGLAIAEFVALGRTLGVLHTYRPRAEPPGTERHPEDYPEVWVFDYGTTQGREAFWHFDVMPNRQPARASLLQAREVPAVGGDTLFCDLAGVHDALPAGVRARLEGAVGLYDFVFERRLARFRGRDESEAMALSPEPLQAFPLLRVRSDGRRFLFINPSFLVAVQGWSPQETQELLMMARDRIGRPEHQCRFRWRAGDVAFWDNLACLHYATNDYWPARRTMERLTLMEMGEVSIHSSPENERLG